MIVICLPSLLFHIVITIDAAILMIQKKIQGRAPFTQADRMSTCRPRHVLPPIFILIHDFLFRATFLVLSTKKIRHFWNVF